MMRIRIDGGALTSEQLRVVADIATTYGRGRRRHHRPAERAAALDPHRGRPGDLANARGGWPVDDRSLRRHPARHARLPARRRRRRLGARRRTRLRAVVERYLGDPAFSNLPRKYKTSISGCAQHCTNHEINDCSFVGVIGPDGTAGFDVWVGGGLSTNPLFAERLGVFVPPEEVSEVWVGVTSIFRDYGYRRQRNHARLKFLMADWGPEKFREVLETEYLHRALPRRPARRRPRRRTATTPASSRRTTAGVASAPRHVRAHLRHGAARSRRPRRRATAPGTVALTAQQGIVVLDVAPEQRRGTGRRTRPARLHGPPVRVPARNDRLHRYRVLQARTGRDQGPRRRHPARAGEAAARLRHSDHDQRERLPELVRPVPGRRHRLQGHGAQGRRR